MVLSYWMITMASMFVFTVVIAVCYCISAIRLARQVKTEEPELWITVGSPKMFPMSFNIFDRIQAFRGQMRFLNWFYTGAEGAKSPKTKAMAATARRLCRITMMGFIGLSLGIFLSLGVALFILVTKGSA
jgi:hypothetical protein